MVRADGVPAAVVRTTVEAVLPAGADSRSTVGCHLPRDPDVYGIDVGVPLRLLAARGVQAGISLLLAARSAADPRYLRADELYVLSNCHANPFTLPHAVLRGHPVFRGDDGRFICGI